ncbi:Log1p NDAI_0G05810 [Naumovozyma dairenensis CBS 421]|uniref:Cytokinin riboside 5'-monophosphate phosphoribohydrolase n=1 Tax=Naumovozyma dairenensis (strain ATCC 10597 / BCRC 20456 / CBS 421 / NBRC 0211 / NRRL Y-12639) TaxID=1071378 RepID=J7REM2_NAUDC|nr:hypothetical protein NDAI_0G05810 [Naumovozyma dairenensis CBS 421]CCK73564.1 hypothetical protein NDAI_0G05810 [Naumovozyma dairenensis CBS 421]
MTMKSVCVYCGSSSGKDKIFSAQANELGKLFYGLGWQLIYGGGTTGLMGQVAIGAMGDNSDGHVHGIIPNALVAKERKDSQGGVVEKEEDEIQIDVDVEDHRGSTPISNKFGKTTVVPDMHSRKRMMAELSDAFVAMPGGYGTMEEIMECITWSQLGIHNKPIVLFNIDGFYDSLLKFVQNSIERGFISEKNGKIVQVATTAPEVIEMIQNYVVPEGRFNLNWQDEGDNEHDDEHDCK